MPTLLEPLQLVEGFPSHQAVTPSMMPSPGLTLPPDAAFPGGPYIGGTVTILPIPEPTTGLLALLGLLPLAYRRR